MKIEQLEVYDSGAVGGIKVGSMKIEQLDL